MYDVIERADREGYRIGRHDSVLDGTSHCSPDFVAELQPGERCLGTFATLEQAEAFLDRAVEEFWDSEFTRSQRRQRHLRQNGR